MCSKKFHKINRPSTLFKKRIWRRCFPVNLVKFLRTLFYRAPLDDCFLGFSKKKNSKLPNVQCSSYFFKTTRMFTKNQILNFYRSALLVRKVSLKYFVHGSSYQILGCAMLQLPFKICSHSLILVFCLIGSKKFLVLMLLSGFK